MVKRRQVLWLLAGIVLIAGGGYYWWSGQPQVDLTGKTVAVLIGAEFYDVEATRPISYLEQAGATVWTVGPEVGEIAGSQGGRVTVTHSLEDVTAEQIDCLVIPGGDAPFALREDPRVIALVQGCAQSDKLLAVVGRGARILIKAELVAGRQMTTWTDTQQELVAAGASLHDQAVVQDGTLLTTRGPGDLRHFCAAIAQALAAK